MRHPIDILILSISSAAISGTALAQPAPTPTPPAPAPSPATTPTVLQPTLEQQQKQQQERDKELEKQAENKATRDFAGLSFGVAIGVTLPVIANRRIEQATLAPNGDETVVRATKRRNASARIMLETHYFFPIGDANKVGIGPMIAIQPGTEEIVEGAGIGLMIGFRRAKDTSDSFNVGAGVFMEPAVKDLGDGIAENRPLPAGETEIRFQEKPAVSLLLVGSFSF